MTTPALLDPRTARLLPWLVAVAFFMQSLDGSILNTALPVMAIELGENPLRMHGVVLVYLITVALLIPLAGWLADRVGTRPVFFGAILMFCTGSALCALAPDLNTLVAARVVQAIGGAMLMPVGRLIVLRAYPRSELVRVMSFVTLPGLVGPLIAPTLGGWLVEYTSWRWIFAINLPIGLVGAIATYRLMPNLRNAQVAGFDYVGFALFGCVTLSIILGLEALVYEVLPSPAWMLMTCLCAALLYVWHASRHAHPLYALDMFKVRSFTLGMLGNLFSRIGPSAIPFITPLMLQIGLGYSPSIAGMSMIPLTLAGMLTKPVIAGLINRFGYRVVMVFTALVQGAVIAAMGQVNEHSSLLLVIALLSLIGVGTYIQFICLGTFTLADLPAQQASSGTSLMSVTLQLGIGLAVSLAGALLGAFSPEGMWPQTEVMRTFQLSYWILGGLTALSALTFLGLKARS